MTATPPDLYLVTPLIEDAEAFVPALREACGAAPVMAVLIRLAPADERTLLRRVKILSAAIEAHGAAAIVSDPGGEVDLVALVTRGGADGGHASDPERLQDLCERLKDGRNIGAGGLDTKHDAMVAGELGVDYVLFGEPGPDGRIPPISLVVERAAWWAEIFQNPCVAYAPTMDAVPILAATGAEFVALGEAVWTHADGPAAAMRAARAALPSHRDRAS
ncbi:thiamine phosphate synthase [uncultured Enterovirga sp.]|uniref:thiamine phosphate synthase n=1 Tax=uncultured Enterovirga sp. TaxID=2026352 RepID=UPI0035CA8B4D